MCFDGRALFISEVAEQKRLPTLFKTFLYESVGPCLAAAPMQSSMTDSRQRPPSPNAHAVRVPVGQVSLTARAN